MNEGVIRCVTRFMTVGGISDVSMGGGTISEVDPDPAVGEASMCPAFREALRGLDTVDLTTCVHLPDSSTVGTGLP